MIRGIVCLVIVVLVIAGARYFSRRMPADVDDAISDRLRDALNKDRLFFARARRDAVLLKRYAKPDLPPGSIGESVKMPPRVVVAQRRRSRRRNRNAGH